PHPVHVEPPTVPGERPKVHPAWVEERLHGEAFFDDPVRRAEEQDARPSGLPSEGGLAHHEDAGDVQPAEEQRRERIQPLQRRRARAARTYKLSVAEWRGVKAHIGPLHRKEARNVYPPRRHAPPGWEPRRGAFRIPRALA